MLKVNSNFTRRGQTYQTPSVNVLDVLSEGVLCSSLDTPDSGYDNNNDLGDI